MVDEPVPPIVPVGDEEVEDVLELPPPLPKATAAPAPAATPTMMTAISVFEMPWEADVAVPVVVAPGVPAPPAPAFAAATVK